MSHVSYSMILGSCEQDTSSLTFDHLSQQGRRQREFQEEEEEKAVVVVEVAMVAVVVVEEEQNEAGRTARWLHLHTRFWGV